MGRYPYDERIWRPLEFLVRRNFHVEGDREGTIRVKWAEWTNNDYDGGSMAAQAVPLVRRKRGGFTASERSTTEESRRTICATRL